MAVDSPSPFLASLPAPESESSSEPLSASSFSRLLSWNLTETENIAKQEIDRTNNTYKLYRHL